MFLSLCPPVYPSHHKPTYPNSNSLWNAQTHLTSSVGKKASRPFTLNFVASFSRSLLCLLILFYVGLLLQEAAITWPVLGANLNGAGFVMFDGIPGVRAHTGSYSAKRVAVQMLVYIATRKLPNIESALGLAKCCFLEGGSLRIFWKILVVSLYYLFDVSRSP